MKILENIQKFFKANPKKRTNKFLKTYSKQKKKKIFVKPETSFFRTKRKKKFYSFRVNFNLKDLSLKEYYEKYQKRNENNHNSYYFFVGGVLIVLSIYAFFFSDYFNLKHIIINPKDNVTNIDMASRAVEEYKFKSIFFVPKDKIVEKLKNYQNNIKTVRIDRLFPNTLRIDVVSHKSVFNVNIENRNYLLLRNGSLVPVKVNKKLAFLEIYYKDLSSKWILEYKKIFRNKYIEKIKYIQLTFLENILKTKIKKIRYYVLEREVHLILENNVILIFSINDDIKTQFENLLLFYVNNWKDFSIKEGKKSYKLYYLDLRIPKKVVYCTVKDAYKCKNNLKNIYDYEEKKVIKKAENKKFPLSNSLPKGERIAPKEEVKKKERKFPKIKLVE